MNAAVRHAERCVDESRDRLVRGDYEPWSWEDHELAVEWFYHVISRAQVIERRARMDGRVPFDWPK